MRLITGSAPIHKTYDIRRVSELAAAFREGDGLLAKLLQDEQMSEEITRDLREMLHNLNLLSQRLESGEGTLGKLIEDPEVYEALNDILVGVDNSKMLRWLVRNRQKSGIEERYNEEVDAMEAEGIEPPPLKGSGPKGRG